MPPSAPRLSIAAEAFVASMPATYREAFDDDHALAHFAVVQGRVRGETRVELWREEEDALAICVVADDRPGLLAKINAALVAHAIDVVAAHAYCRIDADGLSEAVDFLWIRRAPGASAVGELRAADIPHIASMIVALADGRTTFAGSVAVIPASVPPPPRGSSTTVRFEHDDRDGRTILTIEAVDRPGLLLAVTRTLFKAGLQIVGLRASTEGGRAVDRFELAELDGGVIRRERMFTLQTAILCAIDEAGETRGANAASFADV